MSNYLAKNTLPHVGTTPAVRGDGIKFYDANGKQYYDFSSQTLNLLLGKCHPSIVKAIREQAGRISYASSRFGTDVYFEAVELLHSIAPNPESKVNIKMCDGSDANETAIKTARKYTNKPGIISFYKMHTGQTTQTINIRGYGRDERTLIGTTDQVYFVNPPKCKDLMDYLDTLEEIEEIAKREKIGGLILDPLMVNGGLLVNKNTREYLRAIQTICKNYNMIFILDENQTFGWFPTLFASKYWDIDPDIITLGKGLSGGNPLAGVIIKDYLDGVLDYNEADFTNGGNPLCCAATIATINTLLNTNFKIMEKEKIFTEGFSVIKEKFSNVNVRGIGIIWCLDLSDIESDNNLTSSIYKVMLDRGIFLRQYGNKLIFKPPVIVTEEEIRMVMLKLRKVMEEVLCN